MAALIRQANKRVRNGQWTKDKKERMHGEKEGEKREKTTTTLSEKKEEASNVNEQRDKGWIHVIRVHDTTSSDNNTAGQQTLTNYPTQRKNERSS